MICGLSLVWREVKHHLLEFVCGCFRVRVRGFSVQVSACCLLFLSVSSVDFVCLFYLRVHKESTHWAAQQIIDWDRRIGFVDKVEL